MQNKKCFPDNDSGSGRGFQHERDHLPPALRDPDLVTGLRQGGERLQIKVKITIMRH